MILVCAPSPFRVHSHRAAAAPAATPTPSPLTAAGRWRCCCCRRRRRRCRRPPPLPPHRPPFLPTAAASGRRGLCRRRASPHLLTIVLFVSFRVHHVEGTPRFLYILSCQTSPEGERVSIQSKLRRAVTLCDVTF